MHRYSRSLRALACGTVLVAAPAVAQKAARPPIPNLEAMLGFKPGADRHLPSWKQVVDYYTALSRASPRVQLHVLGKTVLGRPFVAAFISDSATIANLDHYRGIQRKLMDPRLRTTADSRDKLIDEGKNVILCTMSIHSTEAGGWTSGMVLADRLVRAESAEAKQILANTIIIIVPSQNPDGVDIVGDWYRSTLGTPAEGTSPPELYHHYTGHDNNRDWYALTQPEQQLVVDSLYGPWDPEIVNDVHQQGSNVSRIFVPPYMDPVEPNIDPILTASTNALGLDITWRMIADGKTGIANNASYDQWSPARQYSYYHRGARILTETASARIASPIDIPFERLGPGRGYDAREVTWNFPVLWPGGHWTYGDIVDYQVDASWALFAAAARDRRAWVSSYATMGDRAVGTMPPWGKDAWPSAVIIPRAQPDAVATQRMLWMLQHGQVEVRESTAPATVDGKTYPAGSYVVLTKQPYGGYAKALLERQAYPNLFEYPGGPPKRPYDVTAHTLPLLLGVDVAHVTGAPPATGAPIAELKQLAYNAPGLSGPSSKRIAIYKSYAESMDEGWTRWVFDTYKIPFTSIHDKDVRAGNLNAKFDVVIIPDQGANGIIRGVGATYPDSLKGGLGDKGGEVFSSFVENGGTLIAFNEASSYAIDALKLPVKNVLAGVRQNDFYAPGSILSVEIDKSSPIAKTFNATVPAVWFENGPAFEITEPAQAVAVAKYAASGNPLLSGWLLGGAKINGKAALVDVTKGKGHAVLFGFRPQYRGQSEATYPLIWGAVLR